MVTLKEAFDGLFEGTVIDKRLLDRLYRYHIKYLNKSREYLEFFAGNLIGVQVVRFTVQDARNFYTDVLNMDIIEAVAAVDSVTTINHDFKISSDPLNLTLMYLINRIGNEIKLSEKDRKRGCYDTALVFFYRALVIRQSEWFHFPADPKIAQAAYAKLSNKFLLKQLGSWRALMDYRAKDLVSEQGLHLKNLLLFTDDDSVTYAISDSENRIRSLYKNYYHEFNNAVVSKDMISISSSTITDIEGVEKLKERTKSVEKAIALLQNLLADKQTFIRADLVKVITDINTNTSQRMLVSVLEWLSENYTDKNHHRKIDEFIRLIVVHSYHLVNEMGAGELNDMAMVLVTLKNLYLSTRSTDPELLKIRSIGQGIIKEAAGKINSSLEMATRSSVVLYITLRTFTASK